jgi:hypothetical protein
LNGPIESDPDADCLNLHPPEKPHRLPAALTQWLESVKILRRPHFPLKETPAHHAEANKMRRQYYEDNKNKEKAK